MHQAAVVAAAIVRDGRVLAACRADPPELAGQWELPGGKVDPGETDGQALVRECAEELGVTVLVGERLGPELVTAGGRPLRAYRCTLVAGEPAPLEHRALRWLTAGELGEVTWLPVDLALLDDLRAALTAARR
jgi:8-oxo-dGTP diphosphatase